MIILILGGLFFLLRPDTPAGAPRERILDASIEGGEMSPAEISVNQDDRVTLRVSSEERMELHLHGYDVEQEVEPGQEAEHDSRQTSPDVSRSKTTIPRGSSACSRCAPDNGCG